MDFGSTPSTEEGSSNNGLSRTEGPYKRPGFASSLTTVFGTQVACATLSLVLEMTYARFLGPSGRGQLSLCLIVVSIAEMLGGFGGEFPITIWSANQRMRPSEWLPAMVSCGVVGASLSDALWAMVYWSWHPLFLKGITPTLARILLVMIPVAILTSYALALATGCERFISRAAATIANQAAALVSAAVLLGMVLRSAEAGLISILLGFAVAGGIVVVLLRDFLFRPWQFSQAPKYVMSALGLGARILPANMATFFNYRLDVFIVNYFLDPKHVGLYAVGVLVSEAVWQIPKVVAVPLLPRTARTAEERDSVFACAVMRQVLTTVCIAGLGIAALSPVVVPFVFGQAFRESVSVIWWILPGTMALALGKVVAADLGGRGKPEYASIFSVVALAVTVILDLTLVPRMGIEGAALASSIAYFSNAALITVAFKRELKVSWVSILRPSATDFAFYRQAWQRMFS